MRFPSRDLSIVVQGVRPCVGKAGPKPRHLRPQGNIDHDSKSVKNSKAFFTCLTGAIQIFPPRPLTLQRMIIDVARKDIAPVATHETTSAPWAGCTGGIRKSGAGKKIPLTGPSASHPPVRQKAKIPKKFTARPFPGLARESLCGMLLSLGHFNREPAFVRLTAPNGSMIHEKSRGRSSIG